MMSVAPMEGVTIFPMRLWLHMVARPQGMTTPFLRVTRAYPETLIPPSFAPELTELRGALPYNLVPQFITGDPQQFLRAAALIAPSLAPILEINCGCPSPNSLGKFAGSGMLHDPEIFHNAIMTLTKELGAGRLAVKMRLGIANAEEFPALLQAIAALPLARLTVHARTRADGYRGHARWDLIQTAAEKASAEVHASGDVLGHQTWNELLAIAPNIRGAMIGRGLLRNPWVFEELRSQQSVTLLPIVLIQALFCYVLIQELWQTHPQKLISRVASGRLGTFCGTDFAAWEKQTVELSNLVTGMPFLLLKSSSAKSLNMSSVATSRLKLLWSYLRSSLPETFASAPIVKAKRAADFFEQLFHAIEHMDSAHSELTLQHNPEWDRIYARERG